MRFNPCWFVFPFAVSIAGGATAAAAEDDVRAVGVVLGQQLARLPPGRCEVDAGGVGRDVAGLEVGQFVYHPTGLLDPPREGASRVGRLARGNALKRRP